jgi:hypothetical protein
LLRLPGIIERAGIVKISARFLLELGWRWVPDDGCRIELGNWWAPSQKVLERPGQRSLGLVLSELAHALGAYRDHPQWIVHDLNNIDKHRILIGVLSGP